MPIDFFCEVCDIFGVQQVLFGVDQRFAIIPCVHISADEAIIHDPKDTDRQQRVHHDLTR
jgi:hypothetical protein